MENKNQKFKKDSTKGDYSKSRRKDYKKESSKEQKTLRCTNEGNDPAWYARNPNLLAAAGSIPFSSLTGRGIRVENVNFDSQVPSGFTGANGAVLYRPGIAKIKFVPLYGRSGDRNSALNVAAQREYSWVRHMNSGSKNYERADLFLEYMAVDNALMYLQWMKRLYGILNTYDPQNAYWPRAIIESMRVDFDDLLVNQTQFWSLINQYTAKLSQFAIPAGLPITMRHVYMVSNLFKDHTNAKSQLYYFQPEGFYMFEPTLYETGGAMHYIPFEPQGSEDYTLENITVRANAIINSLQYIEDIGIMTGDIIKAYGESSILKLDDMAPDFKIEPIYDEKINVQIHNIDTVGEPAQFATTEGYNTMDIYQKDGFLFSDPVFNIYGYSFSNTTPLGTIIDIPSDAQPTPEEVMYATRLTPATMIDSGVDSPAGELGGTHLYSFSSEVATTITVYGYGENSSGDIELKSYEFANRGKAVAVDTNNINGIVRWACLMGNFAWAPKFMPLLSVDGTTVKFVEPIWETKNSTPVSADALKQLHDVAILSLFNITHDLN